MTTSSVKPSPTSRQVRTTTPTRASSICFKIKRVYEPPASTDGFRVLVDRLWPRGISKSDAKLDLWLPDLGPSTSLRKWFNHDPARWAEFNRRYHTELIKKTALLATIKEQAKTRPVTLLYSAKDEQHNQAVALRDFLLK